MYLAPKANTQVGASANDWRISFQNPIPAKHGRDYWTQHLKNQIALKKKVLLPNVIVTGPEDCLYLRVYRPIVNVLLHINAMFVQSKCFLGS